MGLVYANLRIENPARPELLALEVRALVDTGAIHLCVPEHIAHQLGLEVNEHREVSLADGRRQVVPYVGPLRVRFGNRSSFAGALVMGDTVLLGAIPMEDMDLVVHPARLTLGPHPESPNLAVSVAKGLLP